MELQHINIKVYATGPKVDLENVVPVFHEWIRERAIDDQLLIDVADYAHVPAGPGVMLIAHEAFYSLEDGPENRMGLLYNQRTSQGGTNAERLAYAFAHTDKACRLLESDDRLKGIKLSGDELRIMINDRAIAPNSRATFDAVRGDLETALAAFYKSNSFELAFVEQDPRERFTVSVRAAARNPS